MTADAFTQERVLGREHGLSHAQDTWDERASKQGLRLAKGTCSSLTHVMAAVCSPAHLVLARTSQHCKTAMTAVCSCQEDLALVKDQAFKAILNVNDALDTIRVIGNSVPLCDSTLRAAREAVLLMEQRADA